MYVCITLCNRETWSLYRWTHQGKKSDGRGMQPCAALCRAIASFRISAYHVNMNNIVFRLSPLALMLTCHEQVQFLFTRWCKGTHRHITLIHGMLLVQMEEPDARTLVAVRSYLTHIFIRSHAHAHGHVHSNRVPGEACTTRPRLSQRST